MSHGELEGDLLNERSVIVVVPAFCEEAHVGGVVQTMPSFVDWIVVVDDASTDQTSAVAKAVGDERVRVIRHATRRGVGAAIATGYAAALELPCSGPSASDVIAVMAGDGQMAPEDLASVVAPVAHGDADYVKGDRFGDPKVRSAMGWPRWIGGQVFSRLTSLAIGQPVSDSQCGYTAISRRAIESLDLPGLWPSFGYPNDLLGQLAVRGAQIRHVPVAPIYGSEISKLRLRHLPPIFFLIARATARRKAPWLDVSKGALARSASGRHPSGRPAEHKESCSRIPPDQHGRTECERRDRVPHDGAFPR